MKDRKSSRFGQFLRIYRAQADGITQTGLAKLLAVHPSSVSKYESGELTPPPEVIFDIVVQLGLTEAEAESLLEAVRGDLIREFELKIREEAHRRKLEKWKSWRIDP